MQIGAIVQDGGADRDADGAAEVTHQVEQAGCQPEPFHGQSAQRERDDRRHRELLSHAAQRLRQHQFGAAPVVSDRRELPHRQREASQPEHHQPTQVDPVGEERVNRDRQDLEHAGREHRHTNLQGAIAAHPAEEHRRQVDGCEDADAGNEGEKAAQREVAVLERAQVDHREFVAEAAPHEQHAGDAGNPGCGEDHRVAQPVQAGAFFQRVFQATEKQGHQRHA